MRGVEFSRLLREGSTPSTQATSTAPPPPCSQTYKPLEAFIEGWKKPFPWFTVTSTSVSADDRDCITDYLNSGGVFNDVPIPVIYIKRLMDHEMLKIFLPALTKAIAEEQPHTTRNIVDCLSDVVMSRVPKGAQVIIY